MGKNPGYLHPALWTVAGMIDEQYLITWSCERCKTGGPVNLLAVQQKKGPDYCLVDKVSTCRADGCGGTVWFHYSPGRGTPTRPLQANRERQDAAKLKAARQQLEQARIIYNHLAPPAGALQIPPEPWRRRP